MQSCLSKELSHKKAHGSMDRGEGGTLKTVSGCFFFHFVPFCLVIIMMLFTRKPERGAIGQ